MFDNLRNAFREAVENFNKELSRDRVPEAVDSLLAGMQAEVVEAQARVRELEAQIVRATAEAEREKSEAATARRRGKMAEDIGDADTAKVAGEYAANREERQRVLEQKATAMKEELAIRTREVAEMLAKMKEAQASRDGLAASAGRTSARESLYAADDLFGELDRMAEKIGHEDAQAQAAEEFSGLDLDADADFAPPPPPELDVDARLEELKRKMGRE
jgi:phage shock protein A